MRKGFWTLVFFALTNWLPSCFESNAADVNKYVYAIEINGVLCGFSEISFESTGDNQQILRQWIHTNLQALGSRFESEIRLTYHPDDTGAFNCHDSRIDQGDTHLTSVVIIEVLNLSGGTYDALRLEQFNEDTGFRSRIWIDAVNGRLLKSELVGNRVSYLSDLTVKKRLVVAGLDDKLSSPTNVSI